ncbi:MAG TPA: IspD/TarI family cytidylyltransferase [Candidatus Limnocylindrales bacterium]|nr:IspD/TarI family cytidylyltransferase [Candidatus Limnocylindrales bacterium]
MTTGMIVLAGGVGKRIGRPVPKQFLLLGGNPLLVHVLEKVLTLEQIIDVVITCPPAYLDETRQLVANHGFDDRRFRCIEGGASRQESVYRGLEALAGVDSVVIHEAVRPLVTVDEFRSLLDAPDDNVMFGIPIPFTVLKGHDYVEQLLERSELVNVQLPQKFEAGPLRAAHEAARRDGATFTEDASLFYRYAEAPVRILTGSERNLKITVPTDLIIAEAIYADLVGRGSGSVARD